MTKSIAPLDGRTLRELLADVRQGLAVHRPVLVEIESPRGRGDRASRNDVGDGTTTLVQPIPSVEAQAREYSQRPVRSLGPNVLPGPSDEPVTIGRSRSCGVRFDDASVSKLHASVRRHDESGQFMLIDEGSRNGSTIDGQRLAPGASAALWSGVYVGMGRVVVVFLEPVALRTLARLA